MCIKSIKAARVGVMSDQVLASSLKGIIISPLIYGLMACSTVAPSKQSALIIAPDDSWWGARDHTDYFSMVPDSSLGMSLPPQAIRNLAVVKRKMNNAKLPGFVLAISDMNEINAYAQSQG